MKKQNDNEGEKTITNKNHIFTTEQCGKGF